MRYNTELLVFIFRRIGLTLIIDGQAHVATDFGEYSDTGIWDPKKFSGARGTNGFHLKFDDVSSLPLRLERIAVATAILGR